MLQAADSSPSGEQFEIALGDQLAVITEVGAGLRSYSLGGIDIIDGYGPGEMCSAGRGQLLIPWPNRIQDGRYEFDGRQHQLPLNEPVGSNAIHGLVRWQCWSVVAQAANTVSMSCALFPSPGYPFSLAVVVSYELSVKGLTVRTTATNAGLSPCPYAAGFHPYLTLGEPTVDTATLQVPAAKVLRSDERGIPAEAFEAAGTEFDFREARRIGDIRFDHAFTELRRDADGRARVRLAASDESRRLELWLDAAFTHIMIFTGDPIPDVARRSIAVEPMTCAPNAFRTGSGFAVLEPGESSVAEWGIEPTIGAVA